MFSSITNLAGGIGIFLLGMILTTDSLKAMAGESLRGALARLTGQPIKALLVGAGATTMVQSSTATTMATIGFVGAGVLSFHNAIGVIIGANIGSTSTGWIVALLGMKFSISSLALPIIAVGAMMKLLGKERVGLIGLALTGFGLIFVGIDFLQAAMASLASSVDLSGISGSGWWPRFLLVLIGIVMTILLQASSAALVTTMAALSAGTIDFPQAAALVIGQNIGTTATALLAAVGGSASAKRTALVHVLFNVGSGIIAFFALLPLAVYLVDLWGGRRGGVDLPVALACFHTLFSVVGAIVFLPQASLLARMASRMAPEREPEGTRKLDSALLSVPALAIAAVEQTLRMGLADACHFLACRMRGEVTASNRSGMPLDKLIVQVDAYLEKLTVPQSPDDQTRLKNLLLLMDQTRVLNDDIESIGNAEALQYQPALQDLADKLATSLEGSSAWLMDDAAPLPEGAIDELRQVSNWVHEQQSTARRVVVEAAATYAISPAAALDQLAAQRWLERLSKHTMRIAETLAQTRTLYKD